MERHDMLLKLKALKLHGMAAAFDEVIDALHLVNYIDETSWLLHGDRQWLWVMANPEVAYFQI